MTQNRVAVIVAKVFKIERFGDLFRHCRRAQLPFARHVGITLSARLGFTGKQVSEFWCRKPSSVTYAKVAVRDRCQTDKQARRLVDQIWQEILLTLERELR